jgi:hypothetical protein
MYDERVTIFCLYATSSFFLILDIVITMILFD